jgi:hypothetical protein
MLDESLEIHDDDTSEHSDNGGGTKHSIPESEMISQLSTAVNTCYEDLTKEYNR